MTFLNTACVPLVIILEGRRKELDYSPYTVFTQNTLYNYATVI